MARSHHNLEVAQDAARAPGLDRNYELEALVHLQALMDCSHDVLFITSPEGIVLRASKSTARLFGVRAEDWIGRDWDWVEATATLWPSVTRMAMQEKKPLTAEQKTRTGKRLLISATPVTNEKGEITALITSARDVSELITLRNQVTRGTSLTGSYKTHVVAVTTRVGFPSIVAASQGMYDVLDNVERIAATNCTVLLLGESGVGKELVARAIHEHSLNKDGPFVKINCGSIPDSLVESELFGYERGAFTGANREGKPGLFQVAKGGTLFLDEIGELPEPIQPKLLQVLEDGYYLPVGGVQHRKADCRIVAATNANLQEMVRVGKFRADVYYRLAVFPIKIPPLRERVTDIEPLALHFLEAFNRKYTKNLTFSPEFLNLLSRCPWQGNVRELRNTVERIVVAMDDNEVVTPGNTPVALQPVEDTTLRKIEPQLAPTPVASPSRSLKAILTETEKNVVREAWSRCKSTYELAKILGISQPSAVRKVKRYVNGKGPARPDSGDDLEEDIGGDREEAFAG